MSGRPEDRLIAGLWTANESRAALYLGLLLLLLLPAAVGLGLRPGGHARPFGAGRHGRRPRVFSASEVEVQRRARGVALLPVIAGLVYGAAVSAVCSPRCCGPTCPASGSDTPPWFLIFPLLVFATGLRGDPRLCVATGLFGSLGLPRGGGGGAVLRRRRPGQGGARSRSSSTHQRRRSSC